MLNTRQEAELERYFSRIRASCARKTIITVFDLIYLLVLNLPVFIMCALYNPSEGVIETFRKFVGTTNSVGPWRMFIFSLWMFFCCYIYFVLIPAKTKSQTFFSNYLGMRAVTLDDNLNYRGKLSQKQLFKANFLPILVLPLLSALFFLGCAITNRRDWVEKILKQGISSTEVKTSWVHGMRMLVAVVFFMQIHYLFTVSASKRALNWFTKSNRVIYVNVEKAMVVMSLEDKPYPNKNNVDMTVPGGAEVVNFAEEEEEEETAEVKEEEEFDFNKIDFSQDIDMDNNEFLERLYQREEMDKKKDGK